MLAVILVHADVPGVPGGFLGVDIFFVISGYLIHRDLVARIATDRFSLIGFYGRRMRRTLPTLYLVVAATMVGGLALMLPGDLDDLVRSVIGAVMLVPNIVFLTQTGYFDQAAAAKPLLHTWSLGVEEQFYLFAPLLPFALARLSAARRRAALIAVEVSALLLCTGIWTLSHDAVFYLMPSRIFEFLVGAILAERLMPAPKTQSIAEMAAGGATITLGLCIAGFTSAMPHPGVLTLIPCLATATIIHVGTTHQTFTGRLLGLRGPGLIGLMSYSLYLWHWPLIAFARYADWPLTPWHLTLGAVLLLGLSALSWRLIETPFRDPASPWRRRAPVLLPAVAGTLVAACVAMVVMDGLPMRFPKEVASVSAYYAYREQKPFREGQCFITSKNRSSDYDRATCLRMVNDTPNVLLLGDSHAAQLWTGLRDTWPGINVLQATASGCTPVLDAKGASRCTTMMREMFDTFIPNHRLDAIVIGGYWTADDIAPLVATLKRLQGQRIIVFGPVPRYDAPFATLLARAILTGDLASMAQHLSSEAKTLDQRMRIAIPPLATYVSMYDVMCPHDICRLFAAPGVPMQFDYHHLTPAGAAVVMMAVRTDHPSLFDDRAGPSRR